MFTRIIRELNDKAEELNGLEDEMRWLEAQLEADILRRKAAREERECRVIETERDEKVQKITFLRNELPHVRSCIKRTDITEEVLHKKNRYN